MEKLPPTTGTGATPDVLAPVIPGATPDQLALPAAPTIDLPPSAVSEAPAATTRPTVHFEVTTLPPAEGASVAANVGQSEMVAPVDTWAATMPTPEVVPPQPDRAAKVRNAARNAGRFASMAMEAAGALDRTGIPDALIASGIGGRTGTVVRGAAKATKTAAKLNNARHRVEAALQPSPTGEGKNNEVIDPQANLNTGGNGGNNGRPQGPERTPRATTGRARGSASVPPANRYGASTGGGPEMPAAYGTFYATREGGDVPRHAALDPFLGLSREQFGNLASTPEGRAALAARAAHMQGAQFDRLRADRPVRGHRDPRTGEEIPYYGPAEGPLVTGGKIRPAVDRSQRAIHGEPGAGWNPDPRDETAGRPSPRHGAADRSLEIQGDRQPDGLSVPERVRGALRRAFRGRRARREEANWDAAREAGFDEQERRGRQYRGALGHDDVATRHTKGYVDVESSSQPITERKSPKVPPKYAKLKFRNK